MFSFMSFHGHAWPLIITLPFFFHFRFFVAAKLMVAVICLPSLCISMMAVIWDDQGPHGNGTDVFAFVSIHLTLFKWRRLSKTKAECQAIRANRFVRFTSTQGRQPIPVVSTLTTHGAGHCQIINSTSCSFEQIVEFQITFSCIALKIRNGLNILI